MQLDAMSFRQTPRGAVPDTVTVTLTAREVILLGKMNGLSEDQLGELGLAAFTNECTNIYRCVEFEVASRFANGLEDMERAVMEQ